jgi:hypothetical protein
MLAEERGSSGCTVPLGYPRGAARRRSALDLEVTRIRLDKTQLFSQGPIDARSIRKGESSTLLLNVPSSFSKLRTSCLPL